MDREEIRKALLDILCSKDQMSLQLDTSDIKDDTSLLSDVCLDSIQILELVVAIENKFKVCINTEEITLDIFDRFSDLVEYIGAQTGGSYEKI
ncbi:MAG: acyl carrier protein [Nitrospinae bacterium]|nr:acyl carrier protein [Nitrospinota bacterium]